MSYHVINHNDLVGAWILDTEDGVCEFTDTDKILSATKKGIKISGVLIDRGKLSLFDSPPDIEKISTSRLDKGVYMFVSTVDIIASEYDCKVSYYGDVLILGEYALSCTSYCNEERLEELKRRGYLLLRDVSTKGVGYDVKKYVSYALSINYFNHYDGNQLSFKAIAPKYSFPKVTSIDSIHYGTNVGSIANPVLLGDFLYGLLKKGYVKEYK